MRDVAPDELRVVVEAGADYVPSDRVKAALSELSAALHEASGPEVAGFGSEPSTEEVSSVFHTITWTLKAPMSLEMVARPGQLRSLCNNEVVEGTFKF